MAMNPAMNPAMNRQRLPFFFGIASVLQFLLLLLLLPRSVFVSAALPDVVVRIKPTPKSESHVLTVLHDPESESLEFFAKRAQFGSKDHELKGTLVRSPDNDPFLCERFIPETVAIPLPPYDKKPSVNTSTIMLVPRGTCSFERKAYAAKEFYGAKGIMIYDRLGARYQWNSTTDRVIFPVPKYDYECGNGHQFLQNLPLDPPAYNSTLLDPFMGMKTPTTSAAMRDFVSVLDRSSRGGAIVPGAVRTDGFDTSLLTACNLTGTTHDSCESNLCLITSHVKNSTDYPICCAWDVPTTMPSSEDATDLDTDDIFAVWLTIRQSEMILGSEILSYGSAVTLSTRGSTSLFNASYVLMWLWGTFVMALGGWYAAGEYRNFGARLAEAMAAEERAGTGTGKGTSAGGSGGGGRDLSSRSNRSSRSSGRDRSNRSNRSSVSGSGRDRSSRSSRGGRNSVLEAKPKPTSLYAPPITEAVETGLLLLGGSQTQADLESGEFMESQGFEDEIVFRMGGDTKKPASDDREVWSLRSIPPKQKNKESIPKDASSRTARTDLSSSFSSLVVGPANEGTFAPPRESRAHESFEMTHWHVLMFVFMASLTLIMLYFFRIYNFFFVLYGIACGGAASQLIFDPLLALLVPRLGPGWVEEFQKPVICGMNGFGTTSKMLAYTWAIVWIWYGFTHYMPQHNAFFWVTLNIFGAAVCVLSATSLKLNSIKIATLFLGAIFCYDVFFVFITPFFTGGKSIMLNVATGSGNPVGQDFCYKYPNECTGVVFLPMLFMFPKVNDYADGSVLLGLGDIVLPGFLLAFCSRYDEACRLIGTHMPPQGIKVPTKWYQGFFFPMMVAYAIGLFLAFVAVLIMQQGQPALLYICPCCLVTILLLGRNDLKDLWNGAKIFRSTERLIRKTERDWGKARMKRFAEECRSKNNNNNNSSGLASGTAASHWGSEPVVEEEREIDPAEFVSEELTISEELVVAAAAADDDDQPTEPEPRDVCFRNNAHPGTKSFRKVVKEVAAELGDQEEFKPEIYKKIKKKLKGRRFFKKRDDVWGVATKKESVTEIGMAYDKARGKLSVLLKDVPVSDLPVP